MAMVSSCNQSVPEGGPQRRCIVSGSVLPTRQLIRFVVGPDATIVPDVAGRLPGRGLWLQARRDILAKACAANPFARAARSPVRVPAGLADTVVEQLLRRCLELIGLARRAGQAVFGFAKVEAWLREGKAAVLLAAHDGDPRDRARLRSAGSGLPMIETFSGAELGEATGRDRTVHGALAAGRLAETLRHEAARLEAVRYDGTAGRSGDPEHGSK